MLPHVSHMDAAQRREVFDTVAERQERVLWEDPCPERALALRCARALGARPEVIDAVLRADVLRDETTPLGWMRRLLAIEDALASRAS